jgi:hypothetical protein
MTENTQDALKQVEAITNQLKQDAASLNETLQTLLTKQNSLNIGTKKNSDAYKALADQIDKTRSSLKTITDEINKGMQALTAYSGSAQQNIALLAALTMAYNRLTQTQSASTGLVQQLQVNIVSLTNVVSSQTAAVTKSKEAFDFHKGSVDTFKSSFDKLKEGAGSFGPVLGSVSSGFNAMKTGLEVVKAGFQGVGGAIKATGFGLLVLVLQSVTEYFTNTTEGSKKLRGGLAAIGQVVEKVNSVFASLGKFIIDAVSSPVESIKKLGNLIWDNIVNRFKSFAVILDGIIHLDFKKVADGILQNITGVTNATDKIKTAFNATKKAITDTGDAMLEAYNKEKKGATEVNKAAEHHHKAAQIRHQQEMQMHKEQSDADSKQHPDYLIKQLQDTANAFAQKAQLEHNNYATEQAALKNLLDSKLITQEQYHQESQQLEEKYHVGMGEIVKRMDAEQLAKAQQLQKDLVDAQQQKELLAKDQQNVDRAILPGSKLEAEKQLITDKYNFEIQKAAEAGKDTAEIRKQYEQEITDATNKSEQQRKDFALQTAQQVSDKAFSIISNNIKSQSDTKIKGLEKDKTAELSNKNLTSTQRQAIEAKYQKQENAEKVKAFKAEQKASILQAVINGALAITKVTSQAGMLAPFVIPGIIATTAIQVATIAAQKAPQYAQGGLHYQSDGRGALLPGYSRTDNTNAYLRSGEAVVVSEAMRNPWARNLVSAINVAHGGRDFSAPNPGRGYAIGGIFTDGGNANRYYNQPVNDVKDLANTLAYQMINNFPPIYVDVKDVNNQQNIRRKLLTG